MLREVRILSGRGIVTRVMYASLKKIGPAILALYRQVYITFNNFCGFFAGEGVYIKSPAPSSNPRRRGFMVHTAVGKEPDYNAKNAPLSGAPFGGLGPGPGVRAFKQKTRNTR
jgi:hypothetical protein